MCLSELERPKYRAYPVKCKKKQPRRVAAPPRMHRGSCCTRLSCVRAPDIEAHDHSFRVRQISNDLTYGYRQTSNQRGYCEYLVVTRQSRVLGEIDNLDSILTIAEFRANSL